jgi:hypothetical protein
MGIRLDFLFHETPHHVAKRDVVGRVEWAFCQGCACDCDALDQPRQDAGKDRIPLALSRWLFARAPA